MISLIVTLVVLGFALWLVSLIPMDATVRKVVFGVAILLVVLWLLSGVGHLPNNSLHWRR